MLGPEEPREKLPEPEYDEESPPPAAEEEIPLPEEEAEIQQNEFVNEGENDRWYRYLKFWELIKK